MATDSETVRLIDLTRPFAVEDRARSRTELAATFLVLSTCVAVAASGLPILAWLGSVAIGLVNVRVFIFYHDYLHGAIFRKSRALGASMKAYGLFILVPHRVWRDSHNYHHNHTSKIVGSSIGSFPILTVRMYRVASRLQRARYRIARHPLTMLFGYFTVFLLGMCVRPLVEQPRRYWGALLALAVHFGLIGALAHFGSWGLALRVYWVPLMISSALGSYLFYAQHNYPDVKVYERRQWSYANAALSSSSFMIAGPILRWLTGDIGYHHVHHLNSQIPFYHLADAMAAVPELQHPGTTTLRPADVWRCLRLGLWDPTAGKMVSFAEASAQRAVSVSS